MCCIIGKCARKCCEAICALLLSAGVLLLIYWAIFQPRQIRAAVDSAALSNLTVVPTNASSSSSSNSTNAVSYNLAVNLSLYNPSVRVDIYYDAVAARLRFRDSPVLGPAATAASPSEFFQRRKTATVVKLEFHGVAAAGELGKEARGAVMRLELDVDVRVRYVFRVFKLRQKPRVRCSLSVPVRPPEGRNGALDSGGDRCTVKY